MRLCVAYRSQVGKLKPRFVFQAVAKYAVHAGMAIQDHTYYRDCWLNGDPPKQEYQDCKSLVVKQIVTPRSDTRIDQIAHHGHIRSDEHEQIKIPRHVVTIQVIDRQQELSEFFQFE